jgi:hypothetical protein
MKPVIVTEEQWERIWESMKTRERPSTVLSRSKMREVLGFTNRTHEQYVTRDQLLGPVGEEEWNIMMTLFKAGKENDKVFQRTVHLDFYDEQKRVMFLLKYGDQLESQN